MTERSQIGYQITVVLVLWAAGLAAAAQFAKISVIFETFSALYPDAGAAQGFLLSIISFVGVIFGVTGGALVARFGTRAILIGSLALGAVLSVVQAMIPPLPVMLTLRCIEGFSHLGVVIAAPTLIAGLSEGRWQGAVMTLWGSFFGVSFAITAFVGVPLVTALGVPALFLGHGAVMLGCALVLLALLPPVAPSRFAPEMPGVLAQHLRIYRSPWLSAPALGWLFYTLTFVSLLAVLPRFIAESDRDFAITLMPLAGILLSLTLGVVLLRVLPATSVVIAGFGLSAVAAGAFSVWGAGAWLAVALFAVLGLIQGASFAAVAELNKTAANRALANGAMAQMGNTGNLLGTPVLLAIVAGYEFDGLVAFAVVAYMLGGLVHLIQALRRL
ncbi:MAG: MFS transporter [Pseudomonadota bacterium]